MGGLSNALALDTRPTGLGRSAAMVESGRRGRCGRVGGHPAHHPAAPLAGFGHQRRRTLRGRTTMTSSTGRVQPSSR